MIKINLLGNKLDSVTNASTVVNLETLDLQQEVPLTWKENPLIKLVIILSFPVLLFLYENYNIGKLRKESQRTQLNLRQVEANLATAKAKALEAGKKGEGVRELQEKIKFIRELSKTRLIEVKALDSLQSIMPEKLWINNIEYSGNNFNILGRSISKDDYEEFLDNLEKSNFFENALTVKGKTIDDRKDGFFEFNLKISMKIGV